MVLAVGDKFSDLYRKVEQVNHAPHIIPLKVKRVGRLVSTK
jgi:hypothetical protein